MKKVLAFFLCTAFLVCLTPLPIKAETGYSTIVDTGVSAQDAVDLPAAKIDFQNGSLVDSLQSILVTVTDPQVQIVIENAIAAIKDTPTDKQPESWLTWANAVFAAIIAALTLFLAKGRTVLNAIGITKAKPVKRE
jgi:hypothetical protein